MPPPNAPDDALTARFSDDLIALIGPLDQPVRIGLAVSGGPDSLALLLLAHAALTGRIVAATVNHGLRPEAADEAEMVGRVCGTLGVPHIVLSEDRHAGSRPVDREAERTPEQLRHGAGERGNVQARARMLRYRLLGGWAEREGLSFIATAHHRDDVAEGFLMRAIRGSGVGGLAKMSARGSIPYASNMAMLIRPLLGWSRGELVAVVDDAGLVAVRDPSNDDPRYGRATIRALLRREPLLDADQLARAAANLADADAALEWIADQAWKSRMLASKPGEILLDPDDLPGELRRRLARRAITVLSPDWSGEGLDQFLTGIDMGETITLAGVKASGGKVWRFSLAPARRDHC